MTVGRVRAVAACAHPGHVHLGRGDDDRDAVRIDLTPLRAMAGPMLLVAAVWPLLPVHPPVLCPLRATTGVPCPFCGMTRGVVAAIHGHLGASLALNPGAVVVLAFAVALLVMWRWRSLVVPLWSVVAFFGTLWAYELFKYTTGRPL